MGVVEAAVFAGEEPLCERPLCVTEKPVLCPFFCVRGTRDDARGLQLRAVVRTCTDMYLPMEAPAHAVSPIAHVYYRP